MLVGGVNPVGVVPAATPSVRLPLSGLAFRNLWVLAESVAAVAAPGAVVAPCPSAATDSLVVAPVWPSALARSMSAVVAGRLRSSSPAIPVVVLIA